jgi:hypothetical protein
MLRLLEREWWVFGSHLVPVAHRELMDIVDEPCVPLVRFDRAIHVVLVEPPCVADLLTERGGSPVLSSAVDEALHRARRVVARLERHRDRLNAELQIDTDRAMVSVLIGHPTHCPGVSAYALREEVRRLNSFLAGLTVVTYEELLSTADQLLAVDRPEPEA